VIDVYLGSSGELVRRIDDAAGVGDTTPLGDAAHALKSSSANVGASELARLCSEVERLAKNADLTSVSAVVESLQREYRRVTEALRHESELLKGAA
jgi:HPt (histidine-containing phosphotransfer) domain-containing protein